MQEIWKDINGFEGVFKVSNYGNIKRINLSNGTKEKILKTGTNKSGYKCVNLRNGGLRKSLLVHRIVAESFLEKPNLSTEVNHIDENKLNNKVTNLEWCTHLENMKHSYSLHPEWRVKGKIKYNQGVIQMDLSERVINVYKNSFDAEASTKVPKGLIVRCCKGELKTVYGYKWKFAN